MKYGALVFLSAFLALAASWGGLILAPQIQVGRGQQETNAVNSAELYPQARPGLARQGLSVYRANGCADCHTQQVRQTGSQCDVVLVDAGTNAEALAEALMKANVGISKASAAGLAVGLPKPILRRVPANLAKSTVSAIQSVGAKGKVGIVALGPDIARSWGPRRNVAADYLFDDPVLLGSQRIGPDLANVGLRLPDPTWHLRHLYEPRSEVKGSVMPPYRFLFERREAGPHPSSEALQLSGKLAPPTGWEIVPRPEALALVAYLRSLRSDTPLFEAPMSSSAPAQTNAPAR